MSITIQDTGIPDVKLIEPQVFADTRGYFMEAWNERDLTQALGRAVAFVQDNQSCRRKGVVRGLHYQRPPFAQAKLVRCLSGAIFDVAVDVRASSPTFGQWVGVELSAENKWQLWIPEGFAHGFVALTETAEVFYKTNAYWHPEAEVAICWNDDQLAIQWPVTTPTCLSEKDQRAVSWCVAPRFD